MRPSPAAWFFLAAVSACTFRSGHVSATFRDPVVGQARIETLDRERVAVASYKDGQLRGAEAAYDLSNSWADDWIMDRTPVDHPDLPVWRARLQQMRDHAAARDPDPEPLLRAAADFPFSDARTEFFDQWIGGEAERAAQLLDRYDLLAPGKARAQELATLAVRQPQGDDRLGRWIAAMARENHRDAALVVAQSPMVGPQTAAVLLGELDEFSSSARRGLFDAVAPRLLADPRRAYLLVDAVDQLSTSDEAPAMLALLRSPHAERELGLRVLHAIDDFRSTDRAELYAECARLVVGDARGADTLVAVLGELRSSERFGAARQLLERNADVDLIAGLLRATDNLPTRDRPRLIEAVLQQPVWNPTIERAALDAVGEVSGSSSRQRLVDAVRERSRSRIR